MRKIKGLCVLVFILANSVSAETLNDAVQHGMITNPDILFNTAKGLSAEQGILKAKGAYYPTIDVNAGFGRENSLNPTTQAIVGGSGKEVLNRSESSIELRQNIFAGGGIVNEVKRNRYASEGQKLKTLSVAEDLALNVVNRYLQILLQQRLYHYAVANVRYHRATYSMIRERAQSGLSRTAEIDQADARLAQAEADKIRVQADLNNAKISYAKIVGNWPGKLVVPRYPKTVDLPSSLPKAIERGLENHPVLKSTYADVKGAKTGYEVARAAYLPRLDFVLSASQNRNLDGLPGPNNDRLAMLRMNYNIFRGGSDVANVRLSAYEVQQAYETKNKALIELRETIRIAWNEWTAFGLQLKPLRRNMYASLHTREAYTEQFKVDKRTLLDLLDSQNEYYRAQIEYARAENDEIFGRYRILNGTGTLLSYLQMRLPENVVNNDVFTSAETHVLLNKRMDRIPYPDNSERSLYLRKPVRNMELVRPLPAATVLKNTAVPLPVVRRDWFVSVGRFQNKANAIALVNRLKGLGFQAVAMPCTIRCTVLVGPFEYRGHAANTMTRLKEIAHVQGCLVTFKRHTKVIHKKRFD